MTTHYLILKRKLNVEKFISFYQYIKKTRIHNKVF